MTGIFIRVIMKFMKKLVSLSLLIVFLAAALAPDFADAKARKTYKKRYTKRAKRSSRYNSRLPARRGGPSGILSQKYYLEGSASKEKTDNLIAELKLLGAEESRLDPGANILYVKFKSSRLSSISILKKLKDYGYTVKRID